MRAKGDDVDLAKQLYDVLLRPLPAEANRERLIVVPDGILNLLPFDTLRDSTGAFLLETPHHKLCTGLHSLDCSSDRKSRTERRDTRSWVSAMSHIRIRVTFRRSSKNRAAVRQRIDAGISPTLSARLCHDLPQTREEVLAVSKIVGNDGVLLLGSERNRDRVQI